MTTANQCPAEGEVLAVYYKIVEVHKGAVKTLFHGLNGSRTIPVGEWLAADKKLVRDGTSKTQYLSGWHVLPTLKECEEYLEIFTKRLDLLCIVPCEVRGEIRPKVHSRSNVFLADQIKILPGALGSGSKRSRRSGARN